MTDTVQTVQTVQYSDNQFTQQQYWHERRCCSWLHTGLYCIAPRPFTRFVFFILWQHDNIIDLSLIYIWYHENVIYVSMIEFWNCRFIFNIMMIFWMYIWQHDDVTLDDVINLLISLLIYWWQHDIFIDLSMPAWWYHVYDYDSMMWWIIYVSIAGMTVIVNDNITWSLTFPAFSQEQSTNNHHVLI